MSPPSRMQAQAAAISVYMAANLAAFLTAIAHGEGVDRAADPYRVCYTFRHTIVSFANHPAITGEWLGADGKPGELITVGVYAGEHSTAAGRYQITKATWLRLQAKLSLPTFEPVNQDAAAVQLLKECGAYALLTSGEFDGAIAAASRIWASLPGSLAGQPIKPMADLRAAYQGAGGVLAA